MLSLLKNIKCVVDQTIQHGLKTKYYEQSSING